MDGAIENDENSAVRRIRNSPSPPVTQNEENKSGPSDANGTVFWSLVVLGISCLLPWNLFITAHGYFSYKFRSLNESGQTNGTIRGDLEELFEVYFTLTGSVVTVLAAIANVVMASCVSTNRRMIGGHGLVILSLMVSFALTFVDTDHWQAGFLVLNLVLILLSQVGCTFIGGSAFGLAAQLPEPRFTNAVNSAQAFSGIFTSIINILSIAMGSSGKPYLVGAIYFGMALIFTVFSLGIYFALLKNAYAQYYVKKATFRYMDDDTEPLIDSQVVVDSNDDDLLDDSNENKVTHIVPGRSYFSLIKKTVYHGIVMALALMATLICFPSITSLVKSSALAASEWHRYFIPVGCFLMFNTMDFAGRVLANRFLWPKPGSLLIGFFAVLRFGFIFLFLFCNLPSYGMDGKTRIFSDDSYFVFFVALLGLTNGYVANLAVIYLPLGVDENERERAGGATVFYLSTGVLIGCVISLFLVKFVTGSI